MKLRRTIATRLVLLTLVALGSSVSSVAKQWYVPAGGNAFRTSPEPGLDGFTPNQTLAWVSQYDVYSIFFHVDRPADLEIFAVTRSRQGESVLRVSVENVQKQIVTSGSSEVSHQIGRIVFNGPGYVRVDFQGLSKTGPLFGEVLGVTVKSETEGLVQSSILTPENNMYYWGRRGPSVHLRYQTPADIDLRYAYSEITVPEGNDIIGSFFMANGFAQGYFGFQVNSDTERRVLFSVWSPFQTDDPAEIPDDQRVKALASGPNVRIGEFGNEGSGGQSFLNYPWKAGNTYRFLTEVVPDEEGNTRYTSWFGDKSTDEWLLIASFLRPKTDTHLLRFHAFLENFHPAYGHIERQASYGNVWVVDVNGVWHQCTEAQFTTDATGSAGHRLDFAGGVKGTDFYLRNCGFFADNTTPGITLTRDSAEDERPTIDFDRLPRGD